LRGTSGRRGRLAERNRSGVAEQQFLVLDAHLAAARDGYEDAVPAMVAQYERGAARPVVSHLLKRERRAQYVACEALPALGGG